MKLRDLDLAAGILLTLAVLVIIRHFILRGGAP